MLIGILHHWLVATDYHFVRELLLKLYLRAKKTYATTDFY